MHMTGDMDILKNSENEYDNLATNHPDRFLRPGDLLLNFSIFIGFMQCFSKCPYDKVHSDVLHPLFHMVPDMAPYSEPAADRNR